MGTVVDIILVALILLVVYKSYSKGFVATFLDTFSVFISSIVSFLFCGKVAKSAYDLFIGDLVKTEMLQALDELNKGVSVKEKITAMIEALPQSAVSLAKYAGVNIEYLKATLTGVGSATNEELVEVFVDKIAYDVMIGIIEIVSFVVLFIAASILIRLLSNFFSDKLEKIPLVGAADSLLGIIFGLLKGAVIVFAINIVLCVVVATAEQGSPLLAVEDSKIYEFFSVFNPVLEGT